MLCSMVLFGQNFENKKEQNNDVVADFIKLSSQQLYDTANYFFLKNSYDTSLICYNLVINAIQKNADVEQQIKLANAYNRLANIYFLISDYRMAYDLTIKRLLICENYNLNSFKSSIYSNLGLIYYSLNQYDIAHQYYTQALALERDSDVTLLSNIGANALKNGKIKEGYYYLSKALQIIENGNNTDDKHSLCNNFASYFQLIKQYDSAFHYYRLALISSIEQNEYIAEAGDLSDIGKLFFEIHEIDSALYYIDLSNKIASENKFLAILADNYLTLSEIEKSKGKHESALNYHIIYTNLKDSIYNGDVFSSINLFQRQYEVSKTNQQIGKLVFDMNIKENKIRAQRINWFITLGILLLVTTVLFIIVHQKRRLDNAFKVLVDKNVEIVEHQENKSEENNEKHRKNVLTDKAQKILLENILTAMDNTENVCNPEFTIEKLAKLVNSNNHYVSDAINDGLNMNFCSFLNSKRIKEAQRLLANNEHKKFTIEFIAHLVGFKSPNVFRKAFKENTGVNPLFYLNSLKKEG